MEQPLLIGVVPEPSKWERWEEAKALLEPARKLGDFDSVLDPDELLWAVMDGPELLACATAWLSTENYVEVKLIGGRDFRRWVGELDKAIGAAATEAGATRLLAIGRAGWWKALKALGWDRVGEADDMTVYSRELGDNG